MLYTQICIGLFLFIKGLLHFCKLPFLVGASIRNLSQEKQLSYLKATGILNAAFGLLVWVMAVVEKRNLLIKPVFLGVYFVIALLFFLLALWINKKILNRLLP